MICCSLFPHFRSVAITSAAMKTRQGVILCLRPRRTGREKAGARQKPSSKVPLAGREDVM
jgi:hypothetical protein